MFVGVSVTSLNLQLLPLLSHFGTYSFRRIRSAFLQFVTKAVCELFFKFKAHFFNRNDGVCHDITYSTTSLVPRTENNTKQ